MSNIKEMKLYTDANRILKDLEALGYSKDDKLDLTDLNQFDQLHYHGISSVQDAIDSISIEQKDKVLEVGAGWGGPSRYIAHKTQAHVFALEVQQDYSDVGVELTRRTNLENLVTHINQDFQNFSLNESKFDKVVSWLALYHIPNREAYTNKIFNLLHENGMLFIEDLTFGKGFKSSHGTMLENKLFANSLEKYSDYIETCANVGFEIIDHTDMSSSWKNFTSERLKILRTKKKNYEKTHSAEGYRTIEDFYATAAECFSENIIGGIRLICMKK